MFRNVEVKQVYFKDSEIISKDDQAMFLIESLPEFKKPSSKLELLYRGSAHGWRPIEFHSKCDNKGPTLSIIRTNNGRICGGYTSISWTSERQQLADDSAYVLSLDKQNKYSFNG